MRQFLDNRAQILNINNKNNNNIYIPAEAEAENLTPLPNQETSESADADESGGFTSKGLDDNLTAAEPPKELSRSLVSLRTFERVKQFEQHVVAMCRRFGDDEQHRLKIDLAEKIVLARIFKIVTPEELDDIFSKASELKQKGQLKYKFAYLKVAIENIVKTDGRYSFGTIRTNSERIQDTQKLLKSLQEKRLEQCQET